MHHAEPVAHVHVAERGELGSQPLSFRIILRSFRGLEADVLEQRHVPVAQPRHNRSGGRPDQIGRERHRLAEQLAEPVRHHPQGRAARRPGGEVVALRAAEVGHDYHARPAPGQLRNHRQAGAYPAVVCDGAAAGLVQRDVEVGPDQHALPGDLDVVDGTHA